MTTYKGQVLMPDQELDLLVGLLSEAEERLQQLHGERSGLKELNVNPVEVSLTREISLLTLQIANVQRWINRTSEREAEKSGDWQEKRTAFPASAPKASKKARRPKIKARAKSAAPTLQNEQWITTDSPQSVHPKVSERAARKRDDPNRGLSPSTGRRRRASLIG